MGEFACMEVDWDLGAVVRKSCSSEAFAFADIMENPPYLFGPPLMLGDHHQDYHLLNFPPDFFETTAPDFDGREGIYNKPFGSPQGMLITNPTSISAPAEVEKEPAKGSKKRLVSDAADSDSNTPGDAATAKAQKSKRGRRNQHKRVVRHVAADDLSNDIWAWRKYGQKPIKGSSYPRSYYRCSSLKGCPARKQVERSGSDPLTFIITYSAEHSHRQPTRRSALAGTTRTKLPTTKDTVASPKTPSMASIEDEVGQRASITTDHEVEKVLEVSASDNSNLVFPDELFPSLDDFVGLLFDQL